MWIEQNMQSEGLVRHYIRTFLAIIFIIRLEMYELMLNDEGSCGATFPKLFGDAKCDERVVTLFFPSDNPFLLDNHPPP